MSITRRDLLTSAASTAVGAAAGFGADRYLRSKSPAGADADVKTFKDASLEIRKSHARQTEATVAALKKKFEGRVFGEARVWNMIEKLGMCIDVTDPVLLGASQFVHVKQVLAGMERDGVTDPSLHLAALLHDLGKVLLLNDEAPDHVLGTTDKIGEPAAGAGLDHVVFQFGHPEFIWSRMKDHVPDEVAWLLRYHGVSPELIAKVGDERDRRYAEKYLKTFRKYDLWTKSSVLVPAVDMKKYRALIEDRFPKPILF